MPRVSSQLKMPIAQNKAAFAPLQKLCDSKNKEPLGRFGIRTVDELVADGYDLQHANYTETQNAVSYFAEIILGHPYLEHLCNAIGDAQEMYMPSGPPMSPISNSFFSMWAFFDCAIGPERETVGTIMIDSADVIGLSVSMIQRIQKMQDSRMGIYEHIGNTDKENVLLKELITDQEFTCYSSSGYIGTPGELWYARLLPPINEDSDSFLSMTTPYVLLNETAQQWNEYLVRNLTTPQHSELHDFLKYGPTPNYWSEFVFAGYVNYQHEAVFLTGIPDKPKSLPHYS